MTHPKIAGLEPRWAPYAGFSALFDNPDGAAAFHAGLASALDGLDRDLLRQSYMFCALPPSSYHVTAWDGVNDGNLASLRPAVRAEWSRFLRDLPGDGNESPAFLEVVRRSALARWSGGVSFELDEIVVWGGRSLAATLRPADEASERSLEDLAARRAELVRAAEAELGLNPRREWLPHVTLGYFANEQRGRLAEACAEDWTRRFRERLGTCRLPLSSVGMYGFADMASYFRLARVS